MRTLTPIRTDSAKEMNRQYVPIKMKDGKIRCSCGRELVKMDDTTYRCAAGWPMYRFEEGGIIKDKFGNLYMRAEDH